MLIIFVTDADESAVDLIAPRSFQLFRVGARWLRLLLRRVKQSPDSENTLGNASGTDQNTLGRAEERV